MSFGQGGPPFGPGDSSTPDWAALAEDSNRKQARRRRWMMIGGGALATAVVAGIVAVAMVSEGGGEPSDKPSQALPTPEDLPSSPSQPQPSFEEELPPAPPQDYLKDPAKDKAPLSAGTLFPDRKVTVNGRAYTRAATAGTEDCASAAQGGLGAVLEKNDCQKMFRATFERNDGLVFTLGIAVFGSEAEASAVKSDYTPNVAVLEGGGVPDFCREVTCRTTVNSLGRYAFFTTAGHTNGDPAGDTDEPAKQTALDGSNFGYGRLIERGKEQAAADAATG